ncbi:MAG: ABC transporter permease [Desulfobacterales bacterium]|jgi:peptide/nickel transport system permease protein
MHRFNFVIFRPIQMIPVLFGISLITFILIHSIPGDPVRILLGPRATQEVIKAVHAQYGLDKPIYIQYGYFLLNLAKGDMGRSIVFKMPVLALIGERISATLFLLTYGLIQSLVLTLPLAITAAVYRGRVPDHLIRLVSTVGLGFPPFWLGIMLMVVFSVWLGQFPVSGYGKTFVEHLHHLFLPSLTIAVALSAVLVRNLRASLLIEMDSDYVAASRAKGLPERWIFLRHVIRNSLIPTINLLGVNLGWLIGGTVVIETVFSVPGLGSLLVSSIFTRDYMVVMGITMAFACAIVSVNFIVDIATVALDPRIEL